MKYIGLQRNIVPLKCNHCRGFFLSASTNLMKDTKNELRNQEIFHVYQQHYSILLGCLFFQLGLHIQCNFNQNPSTLFYRSQQTNFFKFILFFGCIVWLVRFSSPTRDGILALGCKSAES